jgi:hypothetical protein
VSAYRGQGRRRRKRLEEVIPPSLSEISQNASEKFAELAIEDAMTKREERMLIIQEFSCRCFDLPIDDKEKRWKKWNNRNGLFSESGRTKWHEAAMNNSPTLALVVSVVTSWTMVEAEDRELGEKRDG